MRYCSINRIAASLAVGLALAMSGCSTPPALGPEAEDHGVSAKIAPAEALYEKGDLSAALIACVDLARENPELPGLRDLQGRVLAEISEQRADNAKAHQAETEGRMLTELREHDSVPDTFQLRRNVKGETGSLRKPATAMQIVLRKKVDASFDNISLADFIREAGIGYGLNMIADSSVGADKTMNLNFKQVPLSEVLDYVSRNLGVAFYMGDNVIWVTPQPQAAPGIPMETRMYHLRKGVSPDSIPVTVEAKTQQGQGRGRAAAAAAPPDAAANATQPLNIVEAVQRFVPQPEGADLMFDRKSHTLLVKNTAENLLKAEDVIEALDVCSPQVLIEARFIDTHVTDLRELGVDWMLNSNIKPTKSSLIDKGASLGFNSFPAGNAAQGLNLTYEGVLSDAMFSAVLHALETSGKSRTLSVPRVTTVNNRAADIRVGTDFRYWEEYSLQSVQSTVGAGNNQQVLTSMQLVPSGTPTLEELGIELNVTPSIGADLQSVTLNLHPEISSLDGFQTFSEAVGTNSTSLSLPIFKRSKIETQVIVQSGETVVMGGLITSTEQHDRSGIPILSSIPFVGQLFRHDTVTHEPDNLLIFVTATIISERGEDLIPLAAGPQALPAGATDIPAK